VKTVKVKMVKVKKEHIREEWDEGHPDNGGEGYWIALKEGWCDAGNPQCHGIHEDTKRLAHQEYVMKCNCPDCKKANAK
jgi:hypothetical protein